MMKKPSPRLQVEELDGRILLSGVTHSPQVLGPSLSSQASAAPVVQLNGSIFGQYTTGQTVPDTGTNYNLFATGKVGTLGKIAVSGSLTTPGYVITGRAGGTVTLSNTKGSITLRLVGPVENGFGALPQHFLFTVDHGTGAYSHFQTSGTIDLKLVPARVPVMMPLADHGPATMPLPGRGTFSLTIHETVPPVRTGIGGFVFEGPIAPVVRPGVPNTRPVPGAIISVRTANGVKEVARGKADGQGRFQMALDPGVYTVVAVPQSGQTLPRGTPQRVVVTTGHLISLTLMMDTGIV